MTKSHVSKQNIMRNIKITSLHEFGTFLIPLNSFYTIKKNHCFVENVELPQEFVYTKLCGRRGI